MIEHHFHRSFEVGAGTRFVLSHEDGNVSVTPWDQDVLEVEIAYRAEVIRRGWGDAGEEVEDYRVEVTEGDREIQIAGRRPRVGPSVRTLKELENRFTVKAPHHLDLVLRGEDGDVGIDGWYGRVTIQTKDGAVQLRDMTSPSVEIRMEDGGLKMSRVRVPRIDIESQDGELDLELLRQDDLEGRIRAQDGEVRVGLEAGSSLRFSITTEEGAVEVDHPEAAEVSRRGHKVTGRIGGGDGALTIRTDDGPVLLRQITPPADAS